MAESSTKPYLIRALYEWCCDNGYTPYLAVVVDRQTVVPRQHVKNGEIVLNVSPLATNHMQMGNDLIEFQARFSGVAQQLSIPVENVAAIYARETGHGMAFEVARPTPEEAAGEDPALPGDGGGVAGVVPETAGDGGRDAAVSQAIQPGPRATSAGRKRSAKTGSGADVIAFASPAGGRGKGESAGSAGSRKEGAATKTPSPAGDETSPAAGASTGASGQGPSGDESAGGHAKERGEGGRNMNGADSSGHPPDDHDEPPPSTGGKGGRTRLTRVK